MYLVCIKIKKAITNKCNCLIFKSLQSESNQRPTDYKSVALPAELWRLFRFGIAKVIRFFVFARVKVYFCLK